MNEKMKKKDEKKEKLEKKTIKKTHPEGKEIKRKMKEETEKRKKEKKRHNKRKRCEKKNLKVWGGELDEEWRGKEIISSNNHTIVKYSGSRNRRVVTPLIYKTNSQSLQGKKYTPLSYVCYNFFFVENKNKTKKMNPKMSHWPFQT